MHVFDSYHSRYVPLFSLFSFICIFWMTFGSAARIPVHGRPLITPAIVAVLLGGRIIGCLLLSRSTRPRPANPSNRPDPSGPSSPSSLSELSGSSSRPNRPLPLTDPPGLLHLLIIPAAAFVLFTLAPALGLLIALPTSPGTLSIGTPNPPFSAARTVGVTVTVLSAFGALVLLLPFRAGLGTAEPETGESRSEWIAAALTAAALLSPASPLQGALLICAGMHFVFALVFRLLPIRIHTSMNRRLLRRLSWLPAAVAAAAAPHLPPSDSLMESLSAGVPSSPGGRLITVLSCTAAALRLTVHIGELYRRLGAWCALVPPGRRRGLMRSYLVYYGIPFRRRRLGRFYRNHIAPGSRAWDIGAHLGSRTRVWLDLGARVTAYEPEPVCAAVLENWFAGCPGFRLRACAAGSREGTASIHISDRHPTLATLSGDWVQRTRTRPRFEGIQWNQKHEIPMVRLADEEKRFGAPEFIKIDVEGFEPDVIHGLGTMPRTLSFEVLPGEIPNALECIDELERRGSWMWNLAVGETFRMTFPAPVHRGTLESFLRKLKPSHRGGDIYAYSVPNHVDTPKGHFMTDCFGLENE